MKKSMYLFFLRVSILKTWKKNTGLNVGLSILLLTGLLILLPPFSQSVIADHSIFGNAEDIVIDSERPNNHLGGKSIGVGRSRSNGEYQARIKFNLSFIQVNSEIESAQLKLYRTIGKGMHTLNVQSAIRSWDESTLTWNTSFSTARWDLPSSTYIMINETGYVTVNVTEHVQQWVDGTRTNNGFHLTSDATEDEYHWFASHEIEEWEWRPRLEITWTPYEDDYEENDTPSQADAKPLFPVRTYRWGQQRDDDWYKIEVSQGSERVKVDCQFTDAEGDIDIALYGPDGVTELAYSASVTDNEAIDFTVFSAGYYYIRVYYGNRGNSYKLEWDGVLDSDGDGVSDDDDNCPTQWQRNQDDSDYDGIGDWCDNCPDACNRQQLDADGDGIGDRCDWSPGCGGGCGEPACEGLCIIW
jgi:hypothetical protein